MDRPYLINFSAIISDGQLHIRASITNHYTPVLSKELVNSSPIQSFRLLKKERFQLKIICSNTSNQALLEKNYDSDNYGRFELKIPIDHLKEQMNQIALYETSNLKNVNLYLGSFIPLEIKHPKKIIISDFDKTLVDTKYSTVKEMYYSLNRPLSYFPSIAPSIEILNQAIQDGFQPFILSASPHIYEPAIRDWLYQNKLYVSDIFLKDYRDFISIFDGPLSTKDLKKQGFYKLNKLIDILLMVGIPQELILVGDGFESDPFIYLTLKRLLASNSDPRVIWKSIKNHSTFNLNSKQDSYFITKFYQLSEYARKAQGGHIKILIRSTESNQASLVNKKFELEILNEYNQDIDYYIG